MKKVLMCLMVFASLSCTKTADLGNFNVETWKGDPNGCKGDRAQMIDQIFEVKPKLLGLYQKSIIKALGAPETEELYERSQTYYIYAIDPSEKCDGGPAEDPRMLRIRFTALGIANEVDIR
ncbi:hypothetical protein [Roseivirga thermotolerans]|nr:hypothetical protein [Roseivirga thermotolerans]